MPKQTARKAELFARALRRVLLGVFAVFTLLFVAAVASPVKTMAATSDTINFQARLETAGGAIAADGDYNVEFKVYNASSSSGSSQGSCAGDSACLWTETRTGANKVHVANGYLTVNLGSVTAFGGSIKWDQQLWLTMNIGGTGTPGWDGEMSPRLKLTAVPYAFQAGALAQTDGSGNTGKLSFGTTATSPVITLPDATGIVCLQSSSACGFATGSGTAFLQGGNSFSAQGVLGTNDSNGLALRTNGVNKLVIDTSGNLQLQQTSTFNIASAATGTQLTIQAGAATSGTNIGGNLLLQGGAGASTGASGAVIVKSNTNNSTSAFQVQNASGANLFTADTSNTAIVWGNDGTPSALTVRGGAATGSNVSGSTITFDASNGTGTGTSGDINFRTANNASTPVLFDASSSNDSGGSNVASLSWNHTIGGGSNRLLIVNVTTFTGTISSVTYNGVAMTNLSTVTCTNEADSDPCKLSVWYLKESSLPAAGTYSVVVTPSASTKLTAGAGSFSNVDQTTPFGTSSNNPQVASSISTSVTTSNARQLVYDAVVGQDTTAAPSTNQTVIWNRKGGTLQGGASYRQGNGSTVTMAWRATSGDNSDNDIDARAIFAIPISNVTAAATTSGVLNSQLYLKSNGNVGINNSSPQYSLDVVGNQNLKTTSTTAFQIQSASGTNFLTADTVNNQLTVRSGIDQTYTVGDELYSGNFSSGWTTTGWDVSGVTTAVHNTGNTNALINTSVAITAGQTYKVTFAEKGTCTLDYNTVSASLGGVTLTSSSIDDSSCSGTGDAYSYIVTATNTNKLTFTPDNANFAGTISGISIRQITGANNPLIVAQDFTGSTSLEVRTGPATSENLFVGIGSGSRIASFANFSGEQAAYFNTGIGYNALRDDTTGLANTAVGARALQSNVTGNDNNAFGEALIANLTGSYNNAFGVGALWSNINGSDNSAFGDSTLFYNQTGYDNSAFGEQALFNNISGKWNTALGTFTLNDNTVGKENTAVGDSSLSSNQTGNDNAALGDCALCSNNSGSFNVGVGTLAGGNNVSGSYNSSIGYYAGDTDSGTFFSTLNNLQNATAIGAYAQVQSSNSIVLGSVDNATKVGIGITVPSNTFSVSPLDYQTGTATRTNSSATLVGTGTTWTSAMVGDIIVFADGTTNTVSAFTDATHITMGTTYGGTTDASPVHYRFHRPGFQVASSGNAYVQNTSTTAFQVQNSSGSSLLTADTTNKTVTLNSGNDVATVGSELYSGNFGTNWTTTGWTLGGGNTTAAHNTGNTNSLVDTGHVAITAGTAYRVQFDLSGTCATINAGEWLNVYIGGTWIGNIRGADCTGTVAYVGIATNASGLTFTPTSNWPTTVSNISIKVVSGVIKPVLTVQNASGTPTIEVRTNTNTTSTYVGVDSGKYDVNGGGENTALGYQALQSNTTGSNNVAVGSYALQGDTDGWLNTAVGDIALRSNSTGVGNTAVGNDTLFANTTGGYNTAVGTDSLSENTSGDDNVGVGQCALCDNKTGSYNIALGYFALSGMTSGDSNIGIGLNAFDSNVTGSNNIAIGNWAGSSDYNNTITSTATTALQNAAAFGAYAQVQASNSIVFGSVDIPTKVGIGITVPSNTFSVSPLDYQTGTACATATSGGGACSGTSTTFLLGTGTTWTSAMVGDIVVFDDGVTANITAFTDATHVTLSGAVNEASGSHYRFHKTGFQVTSSGNAYVQNTSTTAFQLQNNSGTSLLTADTTNSTIKIRSGNDARTLGSELYGGNFSTNWTSTGWTLGGGNTTAAHNTGNTNSLIDTGHVAVTAGTTYQISFILSGTCSTYNDYVDVYIGGSFQDEFDGTNCDGNTQTIVGIASGTTGLTFTPSINWSGTISGISVKVLTGTINPALTVQNASGVATLEVRSSSTTSNLFIGVSSGANNVSGFENIALGVSALESVTSGAGNVAVGSYALSTDTTGNFNAAFGRCALCSNTTAGGNSAFGTWALRNDTTGDINSAFGYDVMESNTTGVRNSVIGGWGLLSNTTGSYNSGIGAGVLENNTSGANNVGVGYQALFSNGTGSYNSALGYQAGYQDSGGNFATSSALQNATAIGVYAQVQASNSIVLGSVDTATKVGIGITVPSNTFSISPLDYQTGTATRTNSSATLAGTGTTWTSAMVGDIIVFADGTTNTVSAFTDATHITMGTTYAGTTDASPVHYRFHRVGLQVASAGQLGLGTTNPTAFFDINGRATQQLLNLNGTVNPEFMLQNNGSTKLEIAIPTANGSYVTGSSINDIIIRQTGGQKILFSTSATGVTDDLVLSGGSVGIGTTTPQTSLAVNGTVRAPTLQAVDLVNNPNYAASFTYDSSFLTLSNDFRIRLGGLTTPSGFGISDYDSAMRLWVARTGNVGIGTTNPQYLLDVTGTARVQTSTNSTTAFQIQNAAGDDNLFLANTTNPNLITNSSAESDANGWAINTSTGSVSSDASQSLYGNASLNITTTGATNNQGAKYDTATLLSPTTTYTLSFWAKIAAGSFTVQMGRSDDDTFAGESSCIFAPNTVTTTWTRFICSFTTSGTITTGGYIFIRASDNINRTWYVDGVQLEQASSATNYREGSLQFNGTVTGQTIFENSQNTTTAFQIQNASGSSIMTVDTVNGRIGVGGVTPAATLDVLTGAATVGLNLAGTALSAAGAANGSNASNILTVVGTAGQADAGTGVTAGSGSAISLTTGAGGANTGSSGTPTGGAAGTFTIAGGAGGAANGTTNGTGGAGGAITIQGGNGGAGGVTGTGGAGGNITLQAGNGGATGGAATPGSILIRAGDSLANGNSGSVTIRANATNNSTTAFQVQTVGSATILNVDTVNQRVSVGSAGTATGQLYVSGLVPTGAAGSAATGTAPTSVFVQGRYAYEVNSTTETLEIFDINNPTAPVKVGSVVTSANTGTRYIFVQGRYAYVAISSGLVSAAIQVYDVSNPASPTLVSSKSVSAIALNNIYVQGRYLFFSYTNSIPASKFGAFDISNPATLTAGTQLNITNSGYTFVQGRYAYVTEGTLLQVIDVSNPMSPASVGSLTVGTNLASIYVQGRYAYIADSSANNLRIIDVSNPASPASVSTVSTGTAPSSVFVQDRFAYVTNSTTGTLQVIDVSNVSSPTSVGTVSTGGAPTSVYMEGRYAYLVANSGNTLQAFDVGGGYVQQLEAGGLQVGTLQADSNVLISGDTAIRGGLQVGSSVQITANLGVNGDAAIVSSTNSATAFQVQNASSVKVLSVDTSGLKVNIGAGATGEATPSLLVLDSKTGSSSDPTEVDGAMYYNTTLAQYRCGRDGYWENCGINPIDRGFNIEDEFLGGTTGSGSIGSLGWIRTAITSDCTGSMNAIAAAADRPGELRETTAATLNTGCLVSLNTADMVLAAGQTMKAAFSVSSTTNEQVRVGWYAGTAQADPTTSGLWWEAVNGTANWRYCYATGAAATCANSATAVAANTFVRLEIRLTATGAGTSAATFCINGTCSTVSAVTISTATAVQPGFTCTDTNVATAISCDIDYYQLRGVASGAR